MPREFQPPNFTNDGVFRKRDRQRFLALFFSTNASDRRATDSLRQQACPTCRRTTDSERDTQCNDLRCGLHDRDRWEVEAVVLAYLLQQIVPLPRLAPEAVGELNGWIAQAACAAPALELDNRGHFRRSYTTPSLRAMLHVSIIEELAYLEGDRLQITLSDLTAEEAEQKLRAADGPWLADMMDTAAALRATRSDKQIASALGVSERTIRNRLGSRKQG